MNLRAASPPERRWYLALAGALAGGLALRLLFLGDTALWLDEAFSVWFSEQSWRDLWQEVPRFETHPPLYYSLLKLWRVFGSGETALRLLSVLASVATIGLVALTAAIAAPRPQRLPMAATAAFLLAVSPLQLSLAQQARPYALLMLGMALALAGAAWLVARPERAARPLWRLPLEDRATLAAYLALGLGMAMLLWMHNLGVVFAAALGGVLAAWWAAQAGRRAPLLGNLIAAALLALALYAPNIPTLLQQAAGVSHGFWLQAPSPAGLGLLLLRVYGQWQLTLEGGLEQFAVQMVLAAPLAVLGIGGTWQLCTQGADRRWIARLLLAAALGPLALLLAITYTVQPVLLDRTLAPVQIPWAVLCAAAPFAATRLRGPVAWSMIGMIGLINIAGFVAGQATEQQRDRLRPWRAITAEIAASDAAAAPVIVLPNSAALPLDYYDVRLGAALALHPLPQAFPARSDAYRHPAGGGGEAGIDDGVRAALDAVTAETSTVWLVTRVERLFDPQTIVRRALAERFPCAEIAAFGLITLTRFDHAGEAGACLQRSARHGP